MSKVINNKNHLLDAVVKFFKFYKNILFFAKKHIGVTSRIFWINAFLSLVLISVCSVKNSHFYFLGKIWESLFGESIQGFVWLMDKVPWYLHFTVLFAITLLIFATVVGLQGLKLFNSLNKAIKQIGLKNSIGQHVEVKNIERFSADRFYVEFKGKGVSKAEFDKKSGNLKSAVNFQVESISENEKYPGIIEITFNKKPMTKMLGYQNVCGAASKPGEIVIGQSKKEVVVENIKSFPHMLVAGTSGLGKSNFLKQMTMSLLENTSNLQVYVFDFKEGISFQPFTKLPNVKLYTDIFEANTILDDLKKEMKERLKLAAKAGDEVIDLEKHKKDQILVIIDECSMLYSLSKHDKAQRQIAIKATEVSDEIAKLGRAARFNLVLGNQKVLSKTIDTRIQENLLGRVCFKLPSVSGSNNVLNNKSAATLPNIEGRAIYNFNSVNEEIQAPYLDRAEQKRRIDELQKAFKSKKRATYSPMLGEASDDKYSQQEDVVGTFTDDKK